MCMCRMSAVIYCHNFLFFFFNDTATTEIYTLSLHDALPIFQRPNPFPTMSIYDNVIAGVRLNSTRMKKSEMDDLVEKSDRKSTRLNSSHANISYAVFCLKKKKKNKAIQM